MKHAYIVLMNDKNRDDHYVVELGAGDFQRVGDTYERAARYIVTRCKGETNAQLWLLQVAKCMKWVRHWLRV